MDRAGILAARVGQQLGQLWAEASGILYFLKQGHHTYHLLKITVHLNFTYNDVDINPFDEFLSSLA